MITSSLSPAACLLWAILSTLLLGFLIHHLYHFDRFQCLRWTSSRRNNGTFKRLLTYTYILSAPLLVVFWVTLTSLKYSYGSVQLADGRIIPTPTYLWSDDSRSAVKALYIVLSVAWSLEMVSHLEELNFWLYLLHAGSRARPWLHSPYFIAWCFGSAVAVIGMPVIAGFSTEKYLEANVFITGSAGSLLITLIGLWVVWLFPKFLKQVKEEGAEPEIVLRLTRFNELNNVRLIFRFLFVVPLMILAIDELLTDSIYDTGLARYPFWPDVLAMLAGIGAIVSSSITLLVFFPRTSALEVAAMASQKSISYSTRRSSSTAGRQQHYQPTRKATSNRGGALSWAISLPPKVHHKRTASSVTSFDYDEDPAEFTRKLYGYDNTLDKYGEFKLPTSARDARWLTDPHAPPKKEESPVVTMVSQINRSGGYKPDPPPSLPALHTPGHHLDVDSTHWDGGSSRYEPSMVTMPRDYIRQTPAVPDLRLSVASPAIGTSTSMETVRHPDQHNSLGLRIRPAFLEQSNMSTETFQGDPSVGFMLKKRAAASTGELPRSGGIYTPMSSAHELGGGDRETKLFQGTNSSAYSSEESLALTAPTEHMMPMPSPAPPLPASKWVANVGYEEMRMTGMRYSEAAGVGSGASSTHTVTPRARVRSDSVAAMYPRIETPTGGPRSYEGHVGSGSVGHYPSKFWIE